MENGMDNSRPVRSTPRHASGASLIEVLIAVLVFSLGALGFAAMQATALRNAQSSSERSAAVMQAYAMFDVLRANRDRALIGNFNLTEFTCEAPSTGTYIQNEWNAWITNLKSTLGESACGRIQCGSQGCEVEIKWSDTRGTGNEDDLKELTFKTESRL